MRASCRLPLLFAATVLLVGACAAPIDDGVAARTEPDGPVTQIDAAPAAHAEPRAEVALCSVLPHRIVGELVGTQAVRAVGAGSHCTWHLAAPVPTGEGGGDLTTSHATLQGTFLDARAFEAGRSPFDDASVVAVGELTTVGDEAFVVHLEEPGPTTLYVRDGQRALSLWLADVALTPAATERSLARTAALLLRLS